MWGRPEHERNPHLGQLSEFCFPLPGKHQKPVASCAPYKWPCSSPEPCVQLLCIFHYSHISYTHMWSATGSFTTIAHDTVTFILWQNFWVQRFGGQISGSMGSPRSCMLNPVPSPSAQSQMRAVPSLWPVWPYPSVGSQEGVVLDPQDSISAHGVGGVVPRGTTSQFTGLGGELWAL